jgi:uncharacterized protein (TIGR00369 family)
MNDKEVPNHWEGKCFGCSKTNTHSLALRFWLSDQGCYTRCAIPDFLCGLDGLVHGGIIAFLLDEVAQWAMVSRIGKMGVTKEITVRYLKPVLTNTEIIVEGKIANQKGKNVILNSTICSNDNVLLAESESSFFLANLSIIAEMSEVDEITLQKFLSNYPVK